MMEHVIVPDPNVCLMLQMENVKTVIMDGELLRDTVTPLFLPVTDTSMLNTGVEETTELEMTVIYSIEKNFLISLNLYPHKFSVLVD